MSPTSPTERRAVTYRINGAAFRTAEGFWRELGRAVNGPGGYFGHNLDALADCLRGGFGTDDGPFDFVWVRSDLSRVRLSGPGPGGGALFDEIVAVFTDEDVALELR